MIKTVFQALSCATGNWELILDRSLSAQRIALHALLGFGCLAALLSWIFLGIDVVFLVFLEGSLGFLGGFFGFSLGFLGFFFLGFYLVLLGKN